MIITKNKRYVFLVAILLITSPVLSSASTKTNDTNASEASLNAQTENSAVDPKIAQAIDMVTEPLLEQYLQEIVSVGPRVSGTYGCERTAEYIYQQFEEAGLVAKSYSWKALSDRRPYRFYESQTIEGTHVSNGSYKETLIFNAHYDTIKVSPGANDDGSGVAAVLAAAYVLSHFEFNRTIRFVEFSGEEIGLLGSKAYVKELNERNEDILVEFNADMIGYAETTQGGRNVSIPCTADAKWVSDEITKVNQDYGINMNVKTGRTIEPGGRSGGSDYFNFVLYGYESVAFWEDEWNGEYFHTVNDTIDHVNFSYLTNITKLIVGSLAHLADVEVTYPRVKIATPSHGKLYLEDRILGKTKYDKTFVINDVLVHADVKQGDSPIEKVEFYYDGKLIFTDNQAPYQYRLNPFSIRKHNVKVIAYDLMGRNASYELNFYFLNLFRRTIKDILTR